MTELYLIVFVHIFGFKSLVDAEVKIISRRKIEENINLNFQNHVKGEFDNILLSNFLAVVMCHHYCWEKVLFFFHQNPNYRDNFHQMSIFLTNWRSSQIIAIHFPSFFQR